MKRINSKGRYILRSGQNLFHKCSTKITNGHRAYESQLTVLYVKLIQKYCKQFMNKLSQIILVFLWSIAWVAPIRYQSVASATSYTAFNPVVFDNAPGKVMGHHPSAWVPVTHMRLSFEEWDSSERWLACSLSFSLFLHFYTLLFSLCFSSKWL